MVEVLETLREKQGVKQWQLRIRHLSQDVPFWQGMNVSQDMINSAHIYTTQYTRNQASKQQKTGTHTHLRRYVSLKI
jgi:hypothetical protein